MALDQQPVVDDALNVAKEPLRQLGALLGKGDVDQGAGRGAEGLLADDAADVMPVLDDDARVTDRNVLVRAGVLGVRVSHVVTDTVDTVRQDQREELLARPQGHWLQNRRNRHFSVPLDFVEHQVHEVGLVNKGITLGQLSHRSERILDNTHNRSVTLRRHNQSWYQSQLQNFGPSLHGLGYVKIHFVTVKIGVVGRSDRKIESKSRPGENLDQVAHHGHFV